MRVCIAQNVSISDHLALSTYLRSIAEHLAQFSEIELVLVVQKGAIHQNHIGKDIEVHEIDASLYSLKGNLKYAFNLYKKLFELHEKSPIDILHCIYPFSSLVGASLLKWKTHTPRILYDIRGPWIEVSVNRGSIHRLFVPLYRRVAYFCEKILTRNADGFIIISEGLCRFYAAKINMNSKPVAIIPSGVDLNIFNRRDSDVIRKKHNIDRDDFVVGYVGVMSQMRELEFIVNTFGYLVNADPSYKLMFVGDGDARQNLESLTHRLGIENQVIFTGIVPYEQVPFYMSSFDVGLCHLPDIFEFRYSSPMKILEYAACGKPIVASNIQAHADIKNCIENLYLYEQVPESFLEIVKSIRSNKPLNRTSERISQFDWDNICGRIIQAYQSL